MGRIVTEGFKDVGGITDDGYIYNQSGNYIAKITNSGYITKIGGGETYGKIDEDGTIRDASGQSIGNIQADGYVYIHSKRVGKVDSKFIEEITPNAIIYGKPYGGRKDSVQNQKESQETAPTSYEENSGSGRSCLTSLLVKVIIGIAIAIAFMISNSTFSFGMLIVCPLVVIVASFIIKLFF